MTVQHCDTHYNPCTPKGAVIVCEWAGTGIYANGTRPCVQQICVQHSITLGISLTTCGTFTKAKTPVVKQGLCNGGR